MKVNQISWEIIGAAIEVHRELGPGKTEAAYERALAIELGSRGIPHRVQRPVPVVYKGVKLECGYRLDLLVDRRVVVEVKSAELLHPIHRAQALTYLKLGGWRLALLLNFNVAVLKEGIERIVLGLGQTASRNAIPSRAAGTEFGNVRRPVAWEHQNSSGDPEAERLAQNVIGAAVEVHRELGPGLLPSAYEVCLCRELQLRGIPFERRRVVPLRYKAKPLPDAGVVDLLVGGHLVVAAYASETLRPLDQAETLSHLRQGGWSLGLLINFNTVSLKEGLQRVVCSHG